MIVFIGKHKADFLKRSIVGPLRILHVKSMFGKYMRAEGSLHACISSTLINVEIYSISVYKFCISNELSRVLIG